MYNNHRFIDSDSFSWFWAYLILGSMYPDSSMEDLNPEPDGAHGPLMLSRVVST